jgi:Metallopeptidase toxin 3
MKFHPEELPWSACEDFFRKLCKRVMGSSKLLKAVRKHSGLDKDDVKKYLDWGSTHPLVYFDLKDGSNGWYKHGKTIYINLEIVIAMEFGHDKATRKQVELMMESTVLHEFVHWARKKKSSKSRHVSGASSKKFEAGKSFECAAYGGDITMRNSGLKIKKKNLKGGSRYDSFTCKTKTGTRIEAILKKSGAKK